MISWIKPRKVTHPFNTLLWYDALSSRVALCGGGPLRIQWAEFMSRDWGHFWTPNARASKLEKRPTLEKWRRMRSEEGRRTPCCLAAHSWFSILLPKRVSEVVAAKIGYGGNFYVHHLNPVKGKSEFSPEARRTRKSDFLQRREKQAFVLQNR